MASLKEYFLFDARFNLTSHEEWVLGDQNGHEFGRPISRLNFDFDANALYVSFYIPKMEGVGCPEAILLREVARREYDSIFTREIVERRKLILPVWSGVSVEEVFDYSPILADKLGADWSLGVEEVARRLHIAIETGD